MCWHKDANAHSLSARKYPHVKNVLGQNVLGAKHKFCFLRPREKRRIRKNPNAAEIAAVADLKKTSRLI